jgi:HD superfamily phosphohydrolase
MPAERDSPFDFDANECLPGNPEYVIVHRDLGADPGRARWVASGGAGVVYRAVFKSQMSRAVKILAPEGAPEYGGTTAQAFETTFQREIAILAQVTHTRVAKIMDAGRLKYGDASYLWYAMEFIEGRRFDEVLRDADLTAMAFLELVDQVLDGVEWLHANEIMHCDIKEENVLVRRFGDFQATIVDLGVAKSLKPVDPDAETAEGAEATLLSPPTSPDRTSFFSSKKITREAWRDRLNRDLPRSTIVEMFPGQDLYAIGRLINLAVAEDAPLLPRLRDALGRSGLEALETVVSRLQSEDRRGEDYYTSVRDLRRDWRKLDPRYLAPLNIPELAVGASAKTSIATPAGRVSLTERMVDLINHPLVQRLRLIPQLELLPLLYPGATHTRFLHALSTFDMARRFVAHLLNDPAFRLMAERNDIEATLLWSLLHDVGHFPLSHMFEDFAEDERLTGSERHIPTDDELFWVFVDPGVAAAGPFNSYLPIVADALRTQAPTRQGLHELLADRFEAGTLESLRQINNAQTEGQTILNAVLSSQIDVDKIAYLTDDSIMTGVRYGLGLDLDALLAALRAPRPQDIKCGKPLLALSDKGLTAAEGVVLARYWMLRRVYWHHTNRSTIAMVKYVIDRLFKSAQLDMPTYFRDTLFMDAGGALAYLAGHFERAGSEGALGLPSTNPLVGLLGGGRQIYKRLATVARAGADDAEQRLHDKLSRLSGAALDEIVDDCRKTVADVLGSDLQPGDVIIDIPAKRREELGAAVVVYLQGEENVARDLSDVSPLVAGLRPEFDQHVRKSRVFLHPQIADRLGSRLDEARSRVWETLMSHAQTT